MWKTKIKEESDISLKCMFCCHWCF